MMDPVYWSRAIQSDREREAAKHQFVSRVRALLRQPPVLTRRDAVRTLVFDPRQRSAPMAECCTIGRCA